MSFSLELHRHMWADARLGIRLCGMTTSALLVYATYLGERRLHPITEDRREDYVRAWARSQLRLLGVRMRTVPQIPNTKGPCLVVANHRSGLDIPVLLALCGGSFLARGDMASWPYVGVLAKEAGTLFVDREDVGSRVTAIRTIRKRLETGKPVLVFPEGTTFPGDEVRPFFAGSFLPIIKAHGAVVPIGLCYAEEDAHFGEEDFGTHMMRLARKREHVMSLLVGDPISAGGQRPEVLRDLAHSAVQELVHKARKQI